MQLRELDTYYSEDTNILLWSWGPSYSTDAMDVLLRSDTDLGCRDGEEQLRGYSSE